MCLGLSLTDLHLPGGRKKGPPLKPMSLLRSAKLVAQNGPTEAPTQPEEPDKTKGDGTDLGNPFGVSGPFLCQACPSQNVTCAPASRDVRTQPRKVGLLLRTYARRASLQAGSTAPNQPSCVRTRHGIKNWKDGKTD